MDMEWAKDGLDGLLYIVQSRPETVASQRQANVFESYVLDGGGELIIEGRSVGEKIASGRARVIDSVAHLSSSSRAKSWSPIRRRRTGSRS